MAAPKGPEQLFEDFSRRLDEIQQRYAERGPVPAPPPAPRPAPPRPADAGAQQSPVAPSPSAKPGAFEPPPAPRGPSLPSLARLLAVAFLLAVSAGAYWRWSARKGRVELPLNHTAGLALLNGRFYTVDWLNQQLYSIDPETGKVLGSGHLPNAFPTSLSSSGRDLWSLDGDSGKVLKHSVRDYSVELSRPAPGDDPVAVADDGYQVWVADGASRKIYRLSPPDLEPAAEAVMVERVLALCREGSELWALDAARQVHVLEAMSLSELRSYSLESALPAGSKPTGLAVREGRLWLLTENPAALSSIPLPQG